jgi:predicted acyltransferase
MAPTQSRRLTLAPLPTQRLHSLDAFRGITIAGMILANLAKRNIP